MGYLDIPLKFLNELQNAISLKKNKAHVGDVHRILIEKEATKKSPDDFQGRNDGYKIVIIPGGDYKVGDFINVEITGATPHVLKGRAV